MGDHVVKDPQHSCLEVTPHAGEAKDILEEFLSNLLSREFLVVQDMFLEEMGLTIHVRAVEQPVPIDLLILEGLRLLHGQVRVCLHLEVVLVALLMVLLGRPRAFLWLLGTTFVES